MVAIYVRCIVNTKKSRSIYCSASEYSRLKDFLEVIRVYDNLGAPAFSGDDFDKRMFWKLLKGLDKND